MSRIDDLRAAVDVFAGEPSKGFAVLSTSDSATGRTNLHDQSRLIAAAQRFVADVEKLRPAEVSR